MSVFECACFPPLTSQSCFLVSPIFLAKVLSFLAFISSLMVPALDLRLKVKNHPGAVVHEPLECHKLLV